MPAFLEHIQHGLVLTGLGGPGALVYKQTRTGRGRSTRSPLMSFLAAAAIFARYSPYGTMNVSSMPSGSTYHSDACRAPRTASIPISHVSGQLDYVKPSELADSYVAVLEIVDALENTSGTGT
jgi:aminopeptidase-like protein